MQEQIQLYQKIFNVGFYPSYVQIVERSSSGKVTGTYLFTGDINVLDDYAVTFTSSGITIDCVSEGTLNKVGYIYTVQSRFEWDFHSSAKPIVMQLTKSPSDNVGSIIVELKDNHIYYINDYKTIQFNPPSNVPTYNCYIYITLLTGEDYTPRITIPTSAYGDNISLIPTWGKIIRIECRWLGWHIGSK